MTTKNEATQIKDVRIIWKERELAQKIESYLRKNFGFSLGGGSIVTLEDGTVQHFLFVDTGCAASTGELGKKLKQEFGFKELYLNITRVQ